MKLFGKDLTKDVVVIAEIGNNHEGRFDVAAELIERAAEAGVDVVKFQTFLTERYVSKTDKERFEKLKRFQLTHAEFVKLKHLADAEKIHFLSTPLDLESANFLNTICDVFKIASSDNTFYPLIDTVSSFHKPIILSTGMATLDEIQSTKNFIEERWQGAGVSPGLVLLHCVSAYPTPAEEANLAAIGTLYERFRTPVGYSDHTLGIEAAVLAVAAGARVIEKHFTLDKEYSDFRDHQLSAEPNELRLMVERIRHANTLLGTGEVGVAASEQSIRQQTRRSPIASRNLPAGATLTKSDLIWVRSPQEKLFDDETTLIGRHLKSDVSEGEAITPEVVDPL